MGAVNNDIFRQIMLTQQLPRDRNGFGIIVRAPAITATQNQVTILVTGRLLDRRRTLFGQAGKQVSVSRGSDPVYRDLHITIGAILNTHGHR